jgi:hypothetical protein
MTEFDTFPIVLRASRRKQLLLLLLCLAFVVIGVMMVRDGDSMGYFCGGLFAVGAVVFVVNMLPNASYLRLDEEGFTFCSLFRAHTVRWADIQEFGLVTIRLKRMVAWNFVAGYIPNPGWRSVSRAVGGFEAALADTYGRSASDLLAIMVALHDRSAATEVSG